MAVKSMSEPRTLICSKCLMASCWHGEFYCDEAKHAGLLRATEAQLRRLSREHESYFMPHLLAGHDDGRSPMLTDAMVEAALRCPPAP